MRARRRSIFTQRATQFFSDLPDCHSAYLTDVQSRGRFCGVVGLWLAGVCGCVSRGPRNSRIASCVAGGDGFNEQSDFVLERRYDAALERSPLALRCAANGACTHAKFDGEGIVQPGQKKIRGEPDGARKNFHQISEKIRKKIEPCPFDPVPSPVPNLKKF